MKKLNIIKSELLFLKSINIIINQNNKKFYFFKEK